MENSKELPGDDKLKQTGYVLAVEEGDRGDLSSIPDVVDFSLLIDVTEAEQFKKSVTQILSLPEFGDRVVFCSDPKVVWSAGMGGMMLFRSATPEGKESSYMIFEVKRSAPVQEIVEELFAPRDRGPQ